MITLAPTRTRLITRLIRGTYARAACSAEQALEMITEWSPDLAILDVILPTIDGIALAILLNTKHPNCRIVLTSGHPETSNLLAAAAASGHEFKAVAKPVHPIALLSLASEPSS